MKTPNYAPATAAASLTPITFARVFTRDSSLDRWRAFPREFHKAETIIKQLERIKRKTIEHRPIEPLAVARSRCRIILRCAEGLQSKVVASELGIHDHPVGKWRRRFLADCIDGLLDEARPGPPRTISDDQVAAVIEQTPRPTPADVTHSSIRLMAAEAVFFAYDDPSDVECLRAATAPQPDVQAVERSALHRQGA